MNLLAWCPWPHQRPGRRALWPAPTVDRAGGRHGTRDLCGRTSRRRLVLPHNLAHGRFGRF